jgi:hypothetical protein
VASGKKMCIVMKQTFILQLQYSVTGGGGGVKLSGRCITVIFLSNNDFVGRFTGLHVNWNRYEG